MGFARGFSGGLARLGLAASLARHFDVVVVGSVVIVLVVTRARELALYVEGARKMYSR